MSIYIFNLGGGEIIDQNRWIGANWKAVLTLEELEPNVCICALQNDYHLYEIMNMSSDDALSILLLQEELRLQ